MSSSNTVTPLSTPVRMKLSDAQQAVLQFAGFLLINLGVVTLPSSEPKLIGAIFTFIGFGAILLKAELPSLNPSKLTTQQASLYLAVASMLTAIDGYVALTYESYWWAGLIIGIIGAVILAIKEVVEGTNPIATTQSSAGS